MVVGSGDLREKVSIMEESVVCIKEWKRGQAISVKRGGRWVKGNILEGRESREKAIKEYVWKGRGERKGRRQETCLEGWERGRNKGIHCEEE